MSLVLLLVAAATAARSLTLSQLDTNARVLALDTVGSRQRFTDAQIFQWINEAQSNLIDYSRCLRQDIVFNLTQGVTYYSMPANFLFVERVTVGAKYLQEMSPAALDGRSRAWEVAPGYPTYYFVNFSSRAQVGFAPFPQAASDVDSVKVEYDVQATALVNTTDVPFNNSPDLFTYQYALQYYAAAQMTAIDRQMDRSAAYMAIYQTASQAMQTHCSLRPNYLPSSSATP